uniref:Evasin n=1 Tax=Rhipicephalus microplus TaxID=6941 RepID=A0A6G5A437_RHIMP
MTQSLFMVRFFLWAAIFSVIACHLERGSLLDVAALKEQGLYTKFERLVLQTPAGEKHVGCKLGFTGSAVAQSPGSWMECLTVSQAGYKGMKPGVPYTCKLGLCGNDKQKCNPSNLFIPCWKNETSTQ